MALTKTRIIAGLLGANSLIAPDSDFVNTSYDKGVAVSSGTMSVYSSIDSLPVSASTGTKALVTSTNTLYIYNNGWYKIAIINNFNPQWITQPNSTYDLAINGTATTITVVASDSDDVPITYTAVTDSDFDLIATVTHDSDKHNTWTIVPLDSESGAATGGTGTITFKASDGVNLVSAVSTFSLTFGPDWSATPIEMKRIASDAAAGDMFGSAVELSADGNYAICGARQGNTGTGAAYIFLRSGSNWNQQAKITASNAGASDYFGAEGSASLNSDGTYAMVGAKYEDTGGGNAGMVYVFTRSGTNWSQQTTLQASDRSALQNFGFHVSLNSDATYAAISAPSDAGSSSNEGAVYIFTRSGSTWTQQAKLVASDAAASLYFGQQISINDDGSYVIIGAYGDSTIGTSNGAAYVFTRSGSTWTQQAKITAPNAASYDYFGWDVGMNSDGSYVVISRYSENSNTGSAYVFTRSGSTWTQQAKLTASDGATGDRFAINMAISRNGSYIIVGANGENDNGTNAGAAYVFKRSGSTWTQQRKIISSDIQASDFFGTEVSISSEGEYIIIGAYAEDGGAGDPKSNAGAAYIYEAG